jgi:hypothetical protein
MKTTPPDEWAGSHQSSPISLISPVLLLLKTPVASGTKPSPKGYFWVSPFAICLLVYTAYPYQLHALGCTPICINGVIDRAVVDFTAGLIDILMELGFGQALPSDRWRNSSAKLAALGKALAESTPPSWVDPPSRDPRTGDANMLGLEVMDVDSEDDDNQSFSVPLDLASTNQLSASTSPSAGPSASTSTITPLHQVTAAADDASHQALPAGNVASAAQIQHLQRELKRTRRTLKALKNSQHMSFVLHLIH